MSSTVMSLANEVKAGSKRDREKAVDELAQLLNPRNGNGNVNGNGNGNGNASLNELGDKSYHVLFEALFSFVLGEKPDYYGKKRAQAVTNPAGNRLSKCARAVRMAVGRGASKLGRKTLFAVIDHITQVLPGPDGEFVPPLLPNYVKSLAELLSRQAHAELLSTQDGARWDACVDFFIDIIEDTLPEDIQTDNAHIRASPAPSITTARVTRGAGLASQSQKRATSGDGGPLRDALEGLCHLALASNAPLARRSKPLSSLVLRILSYTQLSLGSIQTLCFTLTNTVLSATQYDDFPHTSTVLRDLVPLMSYWWRAEKVSQDELIRALRNEISRTILLTRLHLEHLAFVKKDARVLADLEELAEPLWLEYSKRGEAFRLQFTDITFAVSSLPKDCLKVMLFGLRPHNLEGESQWALIQSLAFLEGILLGSQKRDLSSELGDGEQPRKKRRTAQDLNRIRLRLRDSDHAVRQTALQLIPFLLHDNAIKTAEAAELLEDLLGCARDKNATTASWALVACASCAPRLELQQNYDDIWKQLWHIATRAVSLPSTSRAASVLLHTVMECEILPYHTIADDVNNIVTTADVNGPAILCDTSLSLMFHLFHVRNSRLPSASQITCSHMIRWLFLKWNPGELGYASFQSSHVPLMDFVNLARICCGAQPISSSKQRYVTGTALTETWGAQKKVEPLAQYLLLLDHKDDECRARVCEFMAKPSSSPHAADSNSFYTSKKLVLELMFPKLEELSEICASWVKKARDGGTQISSGRFQSLISACIIGAMLLPQIGDLNSTQSSSMEQYLRSLAERAMNAALESVEPQTFMNMALKLVEPYVPNLDTHSLTQFRADNIGLLRLLTDIAAAIEARNTTQPLGSYTDIMDLDEEFESHSSNGPSQAGVMAIPRHDMQMRLSPVSFYANTRKRLGLLRTVLDDAGQVGLVPESFVHELLELSDDDLLTCHELLVELCESDLIVDSGIALRIIERLGGIVSQLEYRCCEVALVTCIEVINGMHGIWLQDDGALAESVGDLYHHFIKKCLPSNMFPPKVQISIAQLLFTLMGENPGYGSELGLESCRTSLLSILHDAPMTVKYYISDRVADIFELFVLMVHDEVFVDVLDKLPTAPDDIAGIAFRLWVLSRLACRWSTLLRRCTYHIFETPGKIPASTDYAARCLESVSEHLGLESSRELFHLFSGQILYTWLENDAVEDIPYTIFRFPSLADLLRASQAEAVGLMLMRRQDDAFAELARQLKMKEADLIKANFSTAFSYSLIFANQAAGIKRQTVEDRLSNALGVQLYMQLLHSHFVDMVFLFFDVIDQEDTIEKVLGRHPDLAHAKSTLESIKKISHSSANLPVNQQPLFRAKYVIHELLHLSHRTEYELNDLWTPALVVSVARRLLNTVHPVLGSLHACSVLRKVRILVCLAGPIALESYCLEMLLNSIRGFIVDSECADDALGITQYLLAKGAQYLSQRPSFVCGYALSTLASLRVFLESSQASTTQESQFKATMSKAQTFHQWFRKYLESYTSPAFKDSQQSEAFKSITRSAASIRASGNAEKDTAEAKLLLDILQDQSADTRLLDEPSRQLALQLLCGNFTVPVHIRDDILGSDEDAMRFAVNVWKSCKAHELSNNYLSWSGRVIGRAFSASGEIPYGILHESRLVPYRKPVSDLNGSEVGILALLQDLTSDPDSMKAGLAESALRRAISEAVLQQDDPLIEACQQSLTESLYISSQWGRYHCPPSEKDTTIASLDEHAVWAEDVGSPAWLSNLTIYLARSVPESTLLSVLPPILAKVKGFAAKAFSFVVHLVLYFQLEQQQTTKRSMSVALKTWLRSTKPAAKDNIKLLVELILYLRTQEYPKESSIADRMHWLDVDYAMAASTASWCGMYKTALLFVELVNTDGTRSSRRSSAAKEVDVHDTLLSIFENIDDPDAYYGLPEDASLSNVLARVEYENEGSKSLAFRGAQYDSHVRLRNTASEADGQALVKALSTLGLSGLSHSLLQTQQSLGTTPSSLESTFRTARRLEIWSLPAPSDSHHHAVTVYRAYQSMSQATSLATVRNTIHEGFYNTMKSLAGNGYNATALRSELSSLAVLTELDDLINASDSGEMEAVVERFRSRTQWMRSGKYDDVSQILSCRGTTMSMMSQHAGLVANAKVSMSWVKQLEIRSMLLASGIYRHHQATQETLNIATTLNHMIEPCKDLNLHADAAIKVEAANALWDHGEMATSIRMLQSIDKDGSLRHQTIPVNRSDLLSEIAHKVSVARLEKPHDIQKNYLEPALKELRGTSDGPEAGLVFHQFAVFCDEQLQDPDGLEDLVRLQNLKKGKSDEVEGLKSLISSTKDTQLKNRYTHILSKEKQWLDLDEQELRRVEQTRNEFVRLSLENYLLSLIASDKHDNDALRFTALWLEKSGEEATNKAVMRHINDVPTRKFAGLVNQLTSRLQYLDTTFQKLLLELVYNICVDHPYHGMYQIWSGTKAKTQQKDGVAIQRVKANDKVAQRLAATKSVADIWLSIDKASKYYHGLAIDKNPSKYKSGAKMPLKDSAAGHNLINCLVRYRLPPPTMHIEISATKDYKNVPITTRLDPTMTIASGVSAPKIITALASNGKKYKQLVKGGHDDLRQDAIMEQVFAAVSSLLKLHRSTQQRSLGIRTYKVLPLTNSSGLIEFVPNTIPLHEFLMPAHERYYPKDLKAPQCRKEIFAVQNRTVDIRVSAYRKVTEKFHPVMRYFFMEYFVDPDEWFEKRLAYTRSTAAISMLGHVLGLGDRHGHNILLDTKTGEVVHIDLGVAFEAGRILPVPELVPFRLTRDIVDGMGITKTEGVFRRCCEFTLDALREEEYSIMTILDVLRYDPLYTWSVSPLRLEKLQKARHAGEDVVEGGENDVQTKGKTGGHTNEPSEAERALEVVRKKLSKTLSVTATQSFMTDVPSSPSRRRPRLPSSSSPASSASPSSTPKRPKISDKPKPIMATAAVKGKLPERIDLTGRPSAFQPHVGAKKLVIKNLRKPDGRDTRVEEYYARTEKDLEEAIQAILSSRRPAVPLEKLYRGIEDICRNGNADKLCRMMKGRIEAHLQREVLPRIDRAAGTSNVAVLRNVLAEWKTWNSQALLLRSTFSFLDRTYLLRESQPSLNDIAITQFRRMAFPSQPQVYQNAPGKKAVEGICDLVEADRRGDDSMDSALLRDSTMMLHVLGVYVSHFEPVFLSLSAAYFDEFAKSRSTSSLREYISACERLLQREDDRCMAYNLDSSTEKQLLDSAHKILIEDYSEKLLDKDSMSKLLQDRNVEAMKGLYSLLRLSDIHKKMRAPWELFIKETGASIIGDKERGDDMVLRLLDLRRLLDLMIRDAFGKNDDFLWSMRDAFGRFMNDRTVAACWSSGTAKIGEMTAKYIDMLMRGGIKALPKEMLSDVKDRATAEKEGQASTADEDAELDRQLDQALELFRFIEGKDAFEAFYKKDLARRLLMGRSASRDAERNMLTKLRSECGSNFTHNLEQMFKDQELAKDEMESYEVSRKASSGRQSALDLNVMILSAAAWPTYPDVRLNVPDEVATEMEQFDAYYRKQHTGRTLTWKHSLAHCAIKAVFPRGTKELLVSAFQGTVLMLFNSVPADGFLSYEQISTSTGLQGDDLVRTLQSLACGKIRVLVKHPKGRDVNKTDTFTYNKGFSDLKYRIKINQIQLKETKEENKATYERIAQDRRFETQAAIVRIMKSRKTMGHSDLVAEVINLTKKRGSVEPAEIKKEIESLIEKDYLEREGNAYTYLA
ncbi:Cullin family-domain-containing protein [Stachybotrys elegans]|uniref:Serine/threonine-protein kinase TEL1 n=1 Tax=Stachybotrys elegans TaxID=80388 RepID=A0A8K0SNG3_9HYPO|nr:Cullin family-domain-containing protein [Stachybotrys elegans]